MYTLDWAEWLTNSIMSLRIWHVRHTDVNQSITITVCLCFIDTGTTNSVYATKKWYQWKTSLIRHSRYRIWVYCTGATVEEWQF